MSRATTIDRLTIVPSESERLALRALAGPIPAIRPRAPADPVQRFIWERMNPGVDPDGRVSPVTPPRVRLEDLEQPDGARFDLGAVVTTAAVYRHIVEKHPAFKDHRPDFNTFMRCHAAGDLGEMGQLDPSAPIATVRSRYRLVGWSKPGPYESPRENTTPTWIWVVTAFGIGGHEDPDLARTMTLAYLHRELDRPGRPPRTLSGITQVWDYH